MPLPKLNYPIFELTLPSNNTQIKYRPFLVKEEKILLMAQTSEEPADIVNSIRQVINNCIITEGVNVEDLTTFDLEYLFIKIRSKSVNNVITLTYRDLEDEQKYTVDVDLDQIEIIKDPNHSNKIEINDTMGMIMRYPKADLSKSLQLIDGEMEVFFEVLKSCIESIYDETTVYKPEEYSKEEFDEFVQSLSVDSFKQIQTFFNTMPRLHYEVKYTNSLGKEKVIPLTNLNDFFTLG